MSGLRYILLIVAVSPAILALSITPPNQTALDENTSGSNETCIHIHTAEIGNASIKATACLADYVKYYGYNASNASCTTLESVKTEAKNFLNSMKPCLTNASEVKVSHRIEAVMELVEFSLKDGNFTAFAEHGGSLCVQEAAAGIKQCINQKMGQNITKITFNFTDIVRLNLGSPQGCDVSQIVKPCVNNVLRSFKNCTKESIDYVDSLFDFISQKHCKSNPPSSAPATGSSVSMLIISSLFMLLGIISAS